METLVVYPENDGKRMAEKSLQYQWIVTIRENIAGMFHDRPDVLVAADNLIYPVEGNNRISTAPDVYVAIGRPAGHRGSYRVWAEGGIFPQVVFEILSPSNSDRNGLEAAVLPAVRRTRICDLRPGPSAARSVGAVSPPVDRNPCPPQLGQPVVAHPIRHERRGSRHRPPGRSAVPHMGGNAPTRRTDTGRTGSPTSQGRSRT